MRFRFTLVCFLVAYIFTCQAFAAAPVASVVTAFLAFALGVATYFINADGCLRGAAFITADYTYRAIAFSVSGTDFIRSAAWKAGPAAGIRTALLTFALGRTALACLGIADRFRRTLACSLAAPCFVFKSVAILVNIVLTYFLFRHGSVARRQRSLFQAMHLTVAYSEVILIIAICPRAVLDRHSGAVALPIVLDALHFSSGREQIGLFAGIIFRAIFVGLADAAAISAAFTHIDTFHTEINACLGAIRLAGAGHAETQLQRHADIYHVRQDRQVLDTLPSARTFFYAGNGTLLSILRLYTETGQAFTVVVAGYAPISVLDISVRHVLDGYISRNFVGFRSGIHILSGYIRRPGLLNRIDRNEPQIRIGNIRIGFHRHR